AGVGTVP
nr:RecName: Full=Rhizopuspepsin [Rhizopus azygosporus]